ncbi:MAG: hypothetical protein NDI62_02460 [Burkholderiales bacterium]|nr:hypothetical protein [Burkholderiales bacterium]
MKNFIKFLGIFFVLTFVFINVVNAQNVEEYKPKVSDTNIIYPIKELGSCKDKIDCANFCSKTVNMVACVNYAEEKKLLTGEDLRVSKAVAKRVAEGTTPGGCKSEEECKNFCSLKVENIKECVVFADELKIIPEKDLLEAKKILKALEDGAEMPGSCKTKMECENYCSITSHIDECLNFAEKSEILSKEDLQEAKKVSSFLKEGKTPGKCQNKKECEDFCSKEVNFSECVSFAEISGLISKEDAEIAKKSGGVGPGGCKSKKECEDFCNKEDNIDLCSSFAIEKGLVSEKDKELMTSGIDEMMKALSSMPEGMRSTVEGCLKSSIGEEKYNNILNKTTKPTKEIGSKIEACFGKIPDRDGEIMKNGVPNREDIQKMIPEGIPNEYKEKIREQIQEQTKGITPDISREENRLPEGVGAVGAPVESGPSCDNFISVPSVQYCQMVPEGPARNACIKCKS